MIPESDLDLDREYRAASQRLRTWLKARVEAYLAPVLPGKRGNKPLSPIACVGKYPRERPVAMPRELKAWGKNEPKRRIDRERPSRQITEKGQSWRKIEGATVERILELQREGLDGAAVAARLGCSRHTVFARIRKAKKADPEMRRKAEAARTCACGRPKWPSRNVCTACMKGRSAPVAALDSIGGPPVVATGAECHGAEMGPFMNRDKKCACGCKCCSICGPKIDAEAAAFFERFPQGFDDPAYSVWVDWTVRDERG